GKMDVVHVLFPIVARTRTDPKPRRSPPARSRISSDSLAGRLTKVQVSVRRASHSHSSALKTTFTDLACHASLAPQLVWILRRVDSRRRPHTGRTLCDLALTPP